MSDPKIISETPLSLSELRSHIEEIKKRDKEPNMRVVKTDEYVQLFSKLAPAQATELKEKLQKLEIPRMKEEYISKIIDCMPGSVDELKSLFQGYTITVTKENMQKIIDTVSDYAARKKKK